MALATLSITFTPQVTSNHRVCWKKTTDLTYDCSTIVAGTAGTPVTANITVTVVDDPCEPATFEGYVQPTCEPESSPLVRTDFPDVVYTCGACDCPAGYVYNPTSGFCEQVTIEAALPDNTNQVYTFQNGETNGSYGQNGAKLHDDITPYVFPTPPATQQPLIGYEPSAPYKIFIGSGPATLGTQLTSPVGVSTLFKSNSASTGRLNIAGLWAYKNPPPPIPPDPNPDKWGDTGSGTDGLWLPLRYCLNIPTTQQYIFAMAADNQIRARISTDNGATFTDVLTMYANTIPFNGGSPVGVEIFRWWHMFPITFESGNYILELSGWNSPNTDTAFASEIYTLQVGTDTDVWPAQKTMKALIKSTTANISDLAPYILFSTSSLKNNNAAVTAPSVSPTFSCPSGGTVSNCYGGISCVTVDPLPCGSPGPLD